MIVGVYEKKGTVNYGKQLLTFQIYEIGFIDELVDVSYKTFRERIEAVLLRRYADHIVTKRPYEVYEELGLTYNIMKKGLQRENTNFNTIVIELRKKLITEYKNMGLEDIDAKMDKLKQEELKMEELHHTKRKKAELKSQS